MKFDLNQDEQQQLKDAVDANPVRRWMKQKDQLKFEVGDVLVKMLKRVDWQTKAVSWAAENINSDNKMAQRYVYIYEDDTGIGYLKQLKVSNGELGKEIFVLTDFDYTSTQFQVDPEYAEMIFLDAEFDIKDIHKKSLEARKIVTKMNRKSGMKPKSLSDINKFFESLNPGDTYWITSDYTGRYKREEIFHSKKVISVTMLDRTNDWDWRRYKKKHAVDVTDTYSIKYHDVTYKSDYDQTTYSIFDHVFYKTEPVQEEKKK